MRQRFNFLASTALTTIAAVTSGAALAADLRMPAKAPLPVFSWTGCYAGLNAGGAWARVRQRVEVPGFATFESTDDQDTAFIGGIQAGCNYQYDPNWAFGVEGDINYLSLNRTRNFRANLGGEDTIGSQSTQLRWLSTLRGRLGPTWGRTFLYATGGLAIGNVKSSVSAVVNGDAIYSGSYSETRVGWTVGAGIEHAFAERVSAKLEYLHFDLGTADYSVIQSAGSTPLPATWNASARFSGDIVRVGVNVKLSP